MNLLLLLQSVAAQAADQMPDLTEVTATTIPAEAEMNIIDLAVKGGWIMIVLLILSLIAIYIFVQRFMVIKRAGKEDETFMNRIKDYIHEGKVESALNLCRTTNTPYARMIEKGITRLGRPMSDVLVAIENVGNIEVAKLEKGFPLIATTAAGAPMLGFLGTVTGMVRAFFSLKPSSSLKSSSLSLYRSAAFLTPFSLYSCSRVFSESPSISIQSREAKWSSADTICGAQPLLLVQ